MRGENKRNATGVNITAGTSPRARGKLERAEVSPVSQRNIPACAGKTGGNDTFPHAVQEHPRVRGENRGRGWGLVGLCGTSPRARGKQRGAYGCFRCTRNIPACAGKTIKAWRFPGPCSEHPRVRGENTVQGVLRFRSGGTSPRARGKLTVWQLRRISPRNIPACAGKTDR